MKLCISLITVMLVALLMVLRGADEDIGTDMTMFPDGVQKIEGQNAFWKAVDSSEPFYAQEDCDSLVAPEWEKLFETKGWKF